MTEFDEDFEKALGLEGDIDGNLSREPETIGETEYNDLNVQFISNLKVRSTVPKVEVSYFSSSNLEDAKGDILKIEDGEVDWDHGIPGYQHPTDGIVFTHSLEDLRTKLGTDENARVASAAYSAGYGLRSIISRNLGIDSLDVQCSVTLTRRNVVLTVYDSDVGGAGLCHAVYKDLNDFLQETEHSLRSCVCSDFCESCLLLPRTPTHLIERKLLNRFDGLEFLHQ